MFSREQKKNKAVCLFRRSSFFSIERVFAILKHHWPQDAAPQFAAVPRQGASPLALLCNLVWCLHLRKCGVIHITGDIHYAALVLPGCKTILTIHDMEVLERLRGTWKFRLFRWLWFTMPIRKVRVVTCISEATKQKLAQEFPRYANKLAVIPDPRSDGFVYCEKDFNKESPRILFIGSKSNKNLVRLICALEGILCSLRIIGKVPPKQVKLLEERKISYTAVSGLSDEEVVEEFRRCDMLAFVSTEEGFGMPILEAQATGRPVLTGNCSSMPEVAGRGALLVDPFNVQAIHNGVLRIIQDAALRKELIREGLENVRRFDPERIASQYQILYDRIMKSNAK